MLLVTCRMGDKNGTQKHNGFRVNQHFAFTESIFGFYENFLAALWHDGAKSDKAAEGSSVNENTLLSSQYIIVKQTRREENSRFTCIELVILDVIVAERYETLSTIVVSIKGGKCARIFEKFLRSATFQMTLSRLLK